VRFSAIIHTVKGFWTFVPTTLRHQPPSWPGWIATYSKCSHSLFRQDGFNKTCRHGTQQPSGGCIRFGARQETTAVHPRKGYTNNAGRLSSRRYIIYLRWRQRWQCIRLIIYVYIMYTIMGDNTLFRHSEDIHAAFELTAERREHGTRRFPTSRIISLYRHKLIMNFRYWNYSKEIVKNTFKHFITDAG